MDVQARGVSQTVTSGVGRRDVGAGRRAALGGRERSEYRKVLSHSQPVCTSQCSVGLPSEPCWPMIARLLPCTAQLQGSIPPAFRGSCHQEERSCFHRMGSKHAPWAVQHGGTESPGDPRKAAMGKGTLAFPWLQSLGFLCYPADEIQEVRNLFYCLLCRRKGGVRKGVLSVDADNQWTVLSSPSMA